MAKIKKYILPFLGFIVGVLFFFPWGELRDILITTIEKASGVRITMTEFSPSTGLQMGLMRGSLFAFSGKKATVRLPSGESLSCDDLVIGPRIWPLILTKAEISLGCFSEDSGSAVALISASPFWGPSTIAVSMDLDHFSLANIHLKMDLAGKLSGNFELSEFSLSEKGSPKVEWNLKGGEVRTPEFAIPLLKIPGLELGDLDTEGSYTGRAIKLSKLEFGSKQNLIEAKMSFNSDISEASGAPESGDLKGWIRVDPNAEKSSLKDIPWNIFGKPNDSGKREFKRSFTGGITSLLLAPPPPSE